MLYRTRKQIEGVAISTLRKFNLYNSTPIDIFKIAEEEKIDIIKDQKVGDNVSGILIIKGKKATICIDPDHSETRQRFTIAHELGHFFLKHERDGLFIDDSNQQMYVFHRDEKSRTGEERQEREANAFGAALLMPRHLIVDEILSKNLRFNLADEHDSALLELANDFKVSTQAMTFRLTNLNLIKLI